MEQRSRVDVMPVTAASPPGEAPDGSVQSPGTVAGSPLEHDGDGPTIPSDHLRSTVTVDGRTYERIHVRTHKIDFGEDLASVARTYVAPIYREGDWIALSEKVVSVCQKNARHISTVRAGLLARLIVKGVKKYPNDIAWELPEKMQVAIDVAGEPRMLLATALGALSKPFGVRGVFWMVAGRVAEIDGFNPAAMPPYTEYAILPPQRPDKVVQDIEDQLGVPAAIIDGNNIGVKIISRSRRVPVDAKVAQRIVADNPMGQDDEMTPIILVRPVSSPADAADRSGSPGPAAGASVIARLRGGLPWPLHFMLRKARALREDLPTLWRFLSGGTAGTRTSFRDRLRLVAKCYRISFSVDSPHMEHEMVEVMSAILSLPPSVDAAIVEAGSFKGGSTAKLSLATRLARRHLTVFDSFEGIPQHQEQHGKNIYGGDAYFPPGSYAGSLDEVRRNITRHGAIEACSFTKGLFDDTMPSFTGPVGVAYIDVDLESSTRTCIRHLYPLLVPGGVLFSQDGHLPWVIRLLEDDAFWRDEVGTPKPGIQGLGKRKLLAIRRP